MDCRTSKLKVFVVNAIKEVIDVITNKEDYDPEDVIKANAEYKVLREVQKLCEERGRY